MTLTLREKLIGLGALVLLLGGGYLGWRDHERHLGQEAILLHQADSVATVQQKAVDSASQIAQEAEKQRQAVLDRARVQLARQKADSARQDSLVRVSANERAKAERTLADSMASVGTLRAALSALDSASRADSAATATARAHSQQTIVQLLAVIGADSLALTAERRKSAELQGLADTRAREVALLRKQLPSPSGKVLRTVAEVVGGGGLLWLGSRIAK